MKATMFYHGTTLPPSLKGRAAEIHHLIEPLLKVWNKRMDPQNIQHIQIKLGLEQNLELERILKVTMGRYCLPTQEAQDFEDAAQTNVAASSTSHVHCKAMDSKMFAFTIKMHDLLHLAADVKYLHPQLGWCYAGEDFLDKIKKLMRSCCLAVPHHQVAARVITKYTFAIFHRFCKFIAWK